MNTKNKLPKLIVLPERIIHILIKHLINLKNQPFLNYVLTAKSKHLLLETFGVSKNK